jgi:hypothetical protein
MDRGLLYSVVGLTGILTSLKYKSMRIELKLKFEQNRPVNQNKKELNME